MTIKILVQERAAGAGHTWRERREVPEQPGAVPVKQETAQLGRAAVFTKHLHGSISGPRGPGINGALKGPLRYTESAFAGPGVRVEFSLSEAPLSDCKIGT